MTQPRAVLRSMINRPRRAHQETRAVRESGAGPDGGGRRAAWLVAPWTQVRAVGPVRAPTPARLPGKAGATPTPGPEAGSAGSQPGPALGRLSLPPGTGGTGGCRRKFRGPWPCPSPQGGRPRGRAGEGGQPSARPPGGQQVPLQWRSGGPCPPHPTPRPSPSNFLRPSGQAEVLGAGEGRPWRVCGAEAGRDGESPRGLKQGPKEVGRGRELESWTDWVGGAGRPRNFGVRGAASTGGGGALIRESPGPGPNLGSRKQAGRGLLVTARGPETRTVRSA